jgi:PAS domain S-box-containing protein
MEESEPDLVYAESIVNTIREALIVLDQDLRVVSASLSFYRKFHVTPEETEGRLVYELGNGQWDIPQLRHLLETIIPEKTTIEGFEVRHRFEEIGERVMLLNARRLERAVNKAGLILLAIEDITQRYLIRQKLTESEAKYRKFVEEINSIIIGFDLNGKITFYNHFAEKLFNYRRSEVIGKPFVGTVIPCVDSKGQDNSHICSDIITNPQKFYENESEGICRDGSRIVFSWSAKAVLDASGRVIEILIDGNDITELSVAYKKIEENSAQLKKEHDFVNAVIQTSGALITVIDLDGKITRFNRACEELTGYTENEVIGRSVFDLFIPQEERDQVFEVAARLFAGERWVDFENNWITKAGERRFIRWRNSNLLDDKGVPVLAVATGIDITDRKKADDALRESEERFRLTQELSPDGFLIFRPLRDDAGVVTDFLWIYENESAARMNDTTPEEVIGKRVSEVLPNHDQSPFGKAYKEAAETGKVRIVEDAFYNKDTFKHLLWFRVVAVPISGGDVAILAQDVTERKRAEDALHSRTEELEAAYRDLESFSYSVSHDIRSPLNVIKGFSDILMKDYGAIIDEHGKSILDHVIKAADKMDSLITDLINLARISKEAMNCRKIDLSQIAHSVIKELRQTEPHRNVVITVAPSMPAWADPGYINITLTNLIGNAWKYTGKETDAWIDIGTMRIENQNVYFIRDNGVGFDMNLSDKLFKPFQRLHSDNQFKGTGIGLAIVQKIIQRHGGKIWAESEPGKGASFYFTLLTCAQ